MPIARQLPQMYLRGSLVNVTMAGLTTEQQDEAWRITLSVAYHPEMIPHKFEFMQALAKTIGGDYKDNPASAEQEYLITIWRGVCDLLYHHKYEFVCSHCKSAKRVTKGGVARVLDRIYDVCPNCGMVKVIKSTLPKLKVGSIVPSNVFEQTKDKAIADGRRVPRVCSTIVPRPVAKKYENHQAILEDTGQLRKFFGEYCWNYVRQILAENKRVDHNRDPRPYLGRADEIAVLELAALCARCEIDHSYERHRNPRNGVYTLHVALYRTPPEFSFEVAGIAQRAKENGVVISFYDSRVEIAETADAPLVETLLAQPERVVFVNNYLRIPNSGEEDESFIDQISYRTIRGERMESEDPTDSVVKNDVMLAIYDALPEQGKRVFQILTEHGEAFDQFVAAGGLVSNGPIRNAQIAEFLEISTRAVADMKQTIKHHMLLHGLVPG